MTLFGDALPTGSKVYKSKGPVEEIKDALGKAIPIPKGLLPATLFFVDIEPEANWAHQCLYILILDTGNFMIRHNWPPSDIASMEPIENH